MEMDYTAIKNDIENRIKEKFEPIQKEINNINTMDCGGSGLLSTNNTRILPLDKLCINLNLTYDVAGGGTLFTQSLVLGTDNLPSKRTNSFLLICKSIYIYLIKI